MDISVTRTSWSLNCRRRTSCPDSLFLFFFFGGCGFEIKCETISSPGKEWGHICPWLHNHFVALLHADQSSATFFFFFFCSQFIPALLKLLDIMSRSNETQQTTRGKTDLSTGQKQIVQAAVPYATGPGCTDDKGIALGLGGWLKIQHIFLWLLSSYQFEPHSVKQPTSFNTPAMSIHAR